MVIPRGKVVHKDLTTFFTNFAELLINLTCILQKSLIN